MRAFWWEHSKGKSMEAGGRESKMQEVGKNSRQQESGPSFLPDTALTACLEL